MSEDDEHPLDGPHPTDLRSEDGTPPRGQDQAAPPRSPSQSATAVEPHQCRSGIAAAPSGRTAKRRRPHGNRQ